MAAADLFGRALLDFFDGADVEVGIERDDGYVESERISWYFRQYKEFAECEKKALTHAKGRVLDIGVGAGRVALHLQDEGLDVLGLDTSDSAIEVSRRRGVRSLRKMSACELALDKTSFDTAIAFGNNFGLCGAPDRVEGMLRALRRVLTRDGVFLAASIDPVNTTKAEHLRYHGTNIARGRLPGHVTLRHRYSGQVGEWFDLLLARPSDMSSLCDRAGWRIEKLYLSPAPSPAYVSVLVKS